MQLVLEGTAAVRWADAARPPLSDPGAAVVRPVAVATCDIGVAVLRGRYPLASPYPFGHEAVAEVVEVGDDVRTVSPGDRVVVPFQISCGACGPCRRGRTGNCAAHPRLSIYGLGTMGVSDAWRTVGPQLEVEPGAAVLVVAGDAGPASIGLYAAGIAVALGAERVVYADHDPIRLALAERPGARPSDGALPRKLGAVPITVDASGTEEGLRGALNSTAFDGTCTSPSVYLTDPALPVFSMYSRCGTFHTGRAHGRPAIDRVLTLVAVGFDPSIVTSDVVPWDHAVAALTDQSMKLVVARSQ